MKLFLNLCGIVLAGILGYSLEPNLRVLLTGQTPAKSGSASNGRVIVQMGEGAEKVDLESLKPEQLPEMVRISSGLEVADPASGITMNIPPGNNVKLVRIDGADAVVSQGGTYVGKIPVMDTDLLQRLAEMPPAPAATVPPTGDSAEPPAMPEPPPVPETAPEPPVATNDPAPEPATPAPEPAAPTAAAGGPVDVVQTMQESVKSGQIKEFKFDQVTEWKAGEPETVDGESLETGTALYKAVTFLGEKTIEAKAFIKGGKVQRWIWPRSGMEIK